MRPRISIKTLFLNILMFGTLLPFANVYANSACFALFRKAPIKRPAILEGYRLAETSDKKVYIVFKNVRRAIDFFERGYELTKEQPGARLQFMKPALLGLVKLLETQEGRELTSYDRMELGSGIATWMNALSLVKNHNFLPWHKDHKELYGLVVKIASSPIFKLSEATGSSDFARLFSRMKSSPPEALLQKWLSSVSLAVRNTNSQGPLFGILNLLPVANLTPALREGLAREIVKKDDQLANEATLIGKGLALYNLLLADPPSAWTFYNRYKAEFRTLDLDRPSLVIRPWMYFEQVMGKKVPDYDQTLLKKMFANQAPPTGLEQKMADMLDGLDIKYEQNKLDPLASAIEMDFLITLPGRKINIEVDGIFHYIPVEGGRMQRLQDVRRDEILNAMGIEVFRVSYRELDKPGALEKVEAGLFDFLTKDPE